MRKYRIKRVRRIMYDFIGGKLIMWPHYMYLVQMRTLFGWVTVKSFLDLNILEGGNFAFSRAQELLDMLNENI